MKIILIRHGEAERQTQQDSERTLTELGRAQAKETADKILANYAPDLFVVSPYIRAKQTLDAFTSLSPDTPVSIHDNITPSDDPMIALNGLADVTGNCIVVVCHMPIVARLAALITGGEAESYALAEARVIEAEFIAANMGDEIDRIVPRQH